MAQEPEDNKKNENVEESPQRKIKLNDDVLIPVIGLGTFANTEKESVTQAIEKALECGYSMIDTAELYQNEKYIGDSLKKHLKDKITDMFITTKLKLYGENRDAKSAVEQVNKQLELLQRPYIDLYLLHSPHSNNGGKDVLEIYKALHDECKKNGKIKSIGVSNFNIHHLQILEKYKLPKPSVNQIEVHPFCIETELLDYCRENNIVIQAYCPVARGRSFPINDSGVKKSIFEHPLLVDIAKKHKKTTAQILIRWSIDSGFVVIPKSANPDRIKENIDVFDFKLTESEIGSLNKLNLKQHVSWNPLSVKWDNV